TAAMPRRLRHIRLRVGGRSVRIAEGLRASHLVCDQQPLAFLRRSGTLTGNVEDGRPFVIGLDHVILAARNGRQIYVNTYLPISVCLVDGRAGEIIVEIREIIELLHLNTQLIAIEYSVELAANGAAVSRGA